MRIILIISFLFSINVASQNLGVSYAFLARINSEKVSMNDALYEDGFFCDIYEHGVVKITYKNGKEITEVFNDTMSFDLYEKISDIYFRSSYTFRTHNYHMPKKRVHYGLYYLNQDNQLTNGLIRQHEVAATFDIISSERELILNAIDKVCKH
jgi:hypothetical protein